MRQAVAESGADVGKCRQSKIKSMWLQSHRFCKRDMNSQGMRTLPLLSCETEVFMLIGEEEEGRCSIVVLTLGRFGEKYL